MLADESRIIELEAKLAARGGEPTASTLLSTSDDGEEVHLMMYAGGANPDGLWGNITLEFRKPNEKPRLRSYRAIELTHPPLDADVVKDAARYRWLRKQDAFEIPSCSEREEGSYGVRFKQIPEALDAAIDAAIEAEKARTE